MGCFNDLPADVKWLILRIFIKEEGYINDASLWEDGTCILNDFVHHNACCCKAMRKAALVNQSMLKLIRSKCFRVKQGWVFIKGALTSH